MNEFEEKPKTMSEFEYRSLEAQERIADALERIADVQEDQVYLECTEEEEEVEEEQKGETSDEGQIEKFLEKT